MRQGYTPLGLVICLRGGRAFGWLIDPLVALDGEPIPSLSHPQELGPVRWVDSRGQATAVGRVQTVLGSFLH